MTRPTSFHVAHLKRNPKARKQDLIGERIGDVTVVASKQHPYSELRCELGHKSFKFTSYLRQAKRDGAHVRCTECVKLERERSAVARGS
jgi:hypothetical protein